MTTYYGSSKIHLTALNKGVFLLKLCVRYIDIHISVITGDAADLPHAIIFQFIKGFINLAKTFVDEDRNHPLKIAVGFYVTHCAAIIIHHYFDNAHTLLLPQVVIQC
jgi:hypothetical protein